MATKILPPKEPHLRLLKFERKPEETKQSLPKTQNDLARTLSGVYTIDGDLLNGAALVPSKVSVVGSVRAVFGEKEELTGYCYDVFLDGMGVEPMTLNYRDQHSAAVSRIQLLQRVSAEAQPPSGGKRV